MASNTLILFGILATFVLLTLSESQNEIKYGPPCETPKGENGFCVDLIECRTLSHLLLRSERDTGNIDSLRRSTSMCGGGHGTNVALTEGVSIIESFINVTACCPVEDLRDDLDRKARELLPSHAECGHQSVKGVLDEKITQLGEFPWIVQIISRGYDNKTHLRCHGSLITQDHVLTLAWCVFKQLHNHLVRLGEWNTSSTIDCSMEGDCADPFVDIAAPEYLYHERYDDGIGDHIKFANNIALLRLSQKVTYTDFIRPICLPPRDLAESNFDGMDLIVAGWGGKEFGDLNEVKTKVALFGANTKYCTNQYQQAFGGENLKIHPGQLCAVGAEGKGTCDGDRGAPLMAFNDTDPKETFWYLAGIHSFSYQEKACGDVAGIPSVYTRVNYYYDWILTKLK